MALGVTEREPKRGQTMAILDIENRTESWRTARVLAPLVEKPGARISLASHLVGPEEQCDDSIELELFWKGMRDYTHECQDQNQGDYATRILALYRHFFPSLREQIERCAGFQPLKDHNYVIADDQRKRKLYDNLFNTEVDIVLQTAKHLCIGEAKCGQRLAADSRHILVHQLIRQYVMARILVELKGGDKKVVPFVVGDCRDDLMKTHQVKFMIEMGYLRECNVLSWENLLEILRQDVELRFSCLAEKWLSETAHYSMMSKIVLHSSYQEIIGMGRDVLPLILERLAVEPNHWFWALRAISGEDPVPDADVGRFDAMRDAWLQWGRKRSLT